MNMVQVFKTRDERSGENTKGGSRGYTRQGEDIGERDGDNTDGGGRR